MRKHRRLLLAVVALFLISTQFTRRAPGFTQSSGTNAANGIPMGHEWITRRAAIELLLNNHDPLMPDDPLDPRKKWKGEGLAEDLSLSGPSTESEVDRIKKLPYPDTRYQSTYKPIFDAIIGERWVDIGGFNVGKSKVPGLDCWDAVMQQPPEVQQDHFMRKPDDIGDQGGLTASTNARKRFVELFVYAATASPETMLVWDGGGSPAQVEVDRNYFLFGRAVHLFQDSFSSEHTVRTEKDNYKTVRQVKSYLCAEGSEQHTKSTWKVMGEYTSGDVIWNPGTGWTPMWSTYKPSNMKPTALVAMEATKDLWAAFIRARGACQAFGPSCSLLVENEATKLRDRWLGMNWAEARVWYNSPEHRDPTYVRMPGDSGKGQSQGQCMASEDLKNQKAKIAKLLDDQRTCVYNVRPIAGYAARLDPAVHMPYNWEWTTTGSTWQKPDPKWVMGKGEMSNEGYTGLYSDYCLISEPQDHRYMTAKIENNADIVIGPTVGTWGSVLALNLVRVNAGDGKVFFRSRFAPKLFLGYADGTVKLRDVSALQSYKIDTSTASEIFGTFIISTDLNEYIWRDKDNVRIRTPTPSNMILNYAKWNITR